MNKSLCEMPEGVYTRIFPIHYATSTAIMHSVKKTMFAWHRYIIYAIVNINQVVFAFLSSVLYGSCSHAQSISYNDMNVNQVVFAFLFCTLQFLFTCTI